MVWDMKYIFLSYFVNNALYPKLIDAFAVLRVFTHIIIQEML